MGDGAAPPPGHWGFAEACAVEASAPQQQAVQQQLAIRELAAAMLPCHLDLQEHCTWLDSKRFRVLKKDPSEHCRAQKPHFKQVCKP